MKTINAPLHGTRNISEFVCKGPIEKMPRMQVGASSAARLASQKAWAQYLFLSENKAGIVDEWWLHTPSGLWFVARRDTRTEEILQTWLPQDYEKQQANTKKQASKS